MKKLSISILVFIISVALMPLSFLTKEDYQGYLDKHSYSLDELLVDDSGIGKGVSDILDEESDSDADSSEYSDATASPDSLLKKTLSSDELKIYNSLLEQIRQFKSSYTVSGPDAQTVYDIYRDIYLDYPEYFWLNAASTTQIQQGLDGSTTVTIRQQSGYSSSDLKKMYASMMNKAQKIISAASQEESEFDKILYVHDYLTGKVSYDFDTLNAMNSKTDEFYLSSTAYNCLVKDKAICSGYSAGFQLIMNKLGFECGFVTGTSLEDSQSHGWNYIKAGGEYYYIDVTWDAPASDNGEKGATTHEYFCITEKELKLTHGVDSNQVLPQCNATEFDYYRHNNLYLESYDFSAVSEIIKANSKNKSVSIKFSSEQEQQKAKDDLISQFKIYQIVNSGSIQYSTSNSGEILTVYF